MSRAEYLKVAHTHRSIRMRSDSWHSVYATINFTFNFRYICQVEDAPIWIHWIAEGGRSNLFDSA